MVPQNRSVGTLEHRKSQGNEDRIPDLSNILSFNGQYTPKVKRHFWKSCH